MTLTEQAAELGAKAFHAGKSSVPIHDPEYMELMKSNPDKSIGSSLLIVTAWTKAWHKANIDAPVPGLDAYNRTKGKN